MSALPRGVLMGFFLAAGIGPVSLLCIQYAMTEGVRSALWSGLGSATADALFAAVIGFGLASLSSLFLVHQGKLVWLSSVLLLILGVRSCFGRGRPGLPATAAPEMHSLRKCAAGFLLTVLNPFNFIAYSTLTSALGAGLCSEDPAAVALLTGGVFLGSMGWWVILTTGACLIRPRSLDRTITWINRAVGLLFILLSILLLLWDG